MNDKEYFQGIPAEYNEASSPKPQMVFTPLATLSEATIDRIAHRVVALLSSGELVPRSRLEQVTTVAETHGFDPDDEPYIPLYRILPAPEGAESHD